MTPIAHSIPIALSTVNGAGPKEILGATAGLMWVDRSFAITAGHVMRELLECQKNDPQARVWLGCLEIKDLRERVLSHSDSHDLATIQVDPGELDCLGDTASFYSPDEWPPARVELGDQIQVMGYPRDQWPAQVDFTFRVESMTDRRFGAVLERAGMPARLQGLSGAPAFRVRDRKAEFVGVIVDSLFHNEVIRAQHAYHVDSCGMLSAGADLA